MSGTRVLTVVMLMLALTFTFELKGQVPVQVSDQKVVSEGQVYYIHEVLRGQTLYSIAKAYKVTIDAITGINDIPRTGIQAGQILKVPAGGSQVGTQPGRPAASQSQVSASRPSPSVESPQVEVSDQRIITSGKTYYMHEVKRGQTLYSIAKAYKVTIIDITRENVIPSGGIYAGQILRIPASSSLTLIEPDEIPPARIREEPQEPAREEAKPSEATGRPSLTEQLPVKPEAPEYRMHKVKKGETLYSISRNYNVTVGAILKVNDIPRNEIQAGQMIRIPPSDYEVIVKDEVTPVSQSQSKPAVEPKQEAQLPSTATPVKVDDKTETQPPSGTPVQEAVKAEPQPQQQSEQEAQPQPPAKKAAPKPAQPKKVHKVQKGESLSDIAEKYGITVKELKDANKGVIFAMPDMRLVIPQKNGQENQ